MPADERRYEEPNSTQSACSSACSSSGTRRLHRYTLRRTKSRRRQNRVAPRKISPPSSSGITTTTHINSMYRCRQWKLHRTKSRQDRGHDYSSSSENDLELSTSTSTLAIPIVEEENVKPVVASSSAAAAVSESSSSWDTWYSLSSCSYSTDDVCQPLPPTQPVFPRISETMQALNKLEGLLVDGQYLKCVDKFKKNLCRQHFMSLPPHSQVDFVNSLP